MAPDTADDPTEAALIQIAAELTAIRQLLQREYGAPAEDETPQIECGGCGETFIAETDARRHARSDHGAPEGSEGDLLEGLEHG